MTENNTIITAKKAKFEQMTNNNSMTTTTIRKKLGEYLQVADDKKIKAIYAMVEDEINTLANEWDENFLKELERRSKSFANGSAKTYSWEETKAAVRIRFKSKK